MQSVCYPQIRDLGLDRADHLGGHEAGSHVSWNPGQLVDTGPRCRRTLVPHGRSGSGGSGTGRLLHDCRCKRRSDSSGAYGVSMSLGGGRPIRASGPLIDLPPDRAEKGPGHPSSSSMSPAPYTLIRGRPSQRSQESPNCPQPVRLECRNQTASRWCRQSAALKPAGSSSGCAACQRTIKNVCSVWSCSPLSTFMAASKPFSPPGSHVRYSVAPGVRPRTGPVEVRRRNTVEQETP